MQQIIKGKIIADKILLSVKSEVEKLISKKHIVKLAVVFVGEDQPSKTYIRKKQEAAEQAGIIFELHTFPAKISENELIVEIKKIQTDPELCGLIVQLPLPEKLYTTEVINAINPDHDVDCMTDVNLGKLVMGTNFLTPPTPEAVMTVLRELNIDLKGKDITIVGTGALVGKPLSIMMMNAGASITTANSRTGNTTEKCLASEIIVTGVGKKDLIRANMIRDNAIVIDTGICFVDGKMYGDANREDMLSKAKFFTPTPGGIGPITVSLLLHNVIICAKRKYGNK